MIVLNAFRVQFVPETSQFPPHTFLRQPRVEYSTNPRNLLQHYGVVSSSGYDLNNENAKIRHTTHDPQPITAPLEFGWASSEDLARMQDRIASVADVDSEPIWRYYFINGNISRFYGIGGAFSSNCFHEVILCILRFVHIILYSGRFQRTIDSRREFGLSTAPADTEEPQTLFCFFGFDHRIKISPTADDIQACLDC